MLNGALLWVYREERVGTGLKGLIIKENQQKTQMCLNGMQIILGLNLNPYNGIS